MTATTDLEPTSHGGATAGHVLARMLEPRARDVFPVLRTGFELLDLVLDGGLRPHDLLVLGGAPGVGKSIAALQMARAVAHEHIAYDPVRAETFKQQVVFSVEKNRGGRAMVDLEFRKDFAHYRFHPEGGHLAERLE